MKVMFFRTAANSKNELYEAPMMSIELPADVPQQQAEQLAIEQFQQAMKVLHWKDIAHRYEVGR